MAVIYIGIRFDWEERRAFHTIFKELAVEDKHSQFVALVEQIISPFVTK